MKKFDYTVAHSPSPINKILRKYCGFSHMHSLPSKKESPKQLRKKRKPEATISKMEIVQKEGNREVARQVDFYNLDAIISVGYRVNSFRATNFASGYCVLRQFAVRVHIPLDFEPDKD